MTNHSAFIVFLFVPFCGYFLLFMASFLNFASASAVSWCLPCHRFRLLREELDLWIRSELIERAVRLIAESYPAAGLSVFGSGSGLAVISAVLDRFLGMAFSGFPFSL